MTLADEILIKAEQQNIERYERLIMKCKLEIMKIRDKYKQPEPQELPEQFDEYSMSQ